MSSVSSTPSRRAASSRAAGAPTTKTRSSAGELREDCRVQPDGPAALDDHRVAEGDARPFDRMESGRKAATTTHEVERIEPVRDPQHADPET